MEGQDGNEWKGLSFTDDCATTDNRHVFEHVDFKNTSTAAITAGSATVTTTLSVQTAQEELVHVIPTATSETSP